MTSSANSSFAYSISVDMLAFWIVWNAESIVFCKDASTLLVASNTGYEANAAGPSISSPVKIMVFMLVRFILKSSVYRPTEFMHDPFGFLAEFMRDPVVVFHIYLPQFFFQHSQPVGWDRGKQFVRFARGQFFPFFILTRKRVRENRFLPDGEFEHLPLAVRCRCIRRKRLFFHISPHFRSCTTGSMTVPSVRFAPSFG